VGTDHLLRTLAPVSPASRIVCVGCGDGTHIDALAQLGFDLWASDPDARVVATVRARWQEATGGKVEEARERVVCEKPGALGYPDAYADWVVLALKDAEDLTGGLVEARRVLRPGGWVWVAVAGSDPVTLGAAADAARLAVAETPHVATEGGAVGIYRRAEGSVA
jgi:SAM-dependent methyltransferase